MNVIYQYYHRLLPMVLKVWFCGYRGGLIAENQIQVALCKSKVADSSSIGSNKQKKRKSDEGKLSERVQLF